MITNNRIPYEYFITRGRGCSDFEIHAGSYHIALYNAKICNYNIQTYSSILPKDSKEIDINSVSIPFGSELYTIMSCMHGGEGEYLNCGIVFGELYDKEEKIGSIVCEITNNDREIDLNSKLYNAIMDLHKNTYSNYEIRNLTYNTIDYIPTKKYGTCLVAICFYNFKTNE